jgi:hypothetical protein
MADLDLYRETYAVVAARRTQWDQLLWQVPVLTLTAQAFLFSIALSHDATKSARVIACLLSLVMTCLSLHLMIKHRQAEVADSQWLESYEDQLPPPPGDLSWPMHGRNWSSYRLQTDPRVGRLRFFWRSNGFKIWFWGLALFGVAAIVVLLISMFWPSLLGS